MLVFVGGVLIGGLVGAVVMALAAATKRDADHVPTTNVRTAARSREHGSAWVIAGNGGVTTGSRLGRFSPARRRTAMPVQ